MHGVSMFCGSLEIRLTVNRCLRPVCVLAGWFIAAAALVLSPGHARAQTTVNIHAIQIDLPSSPYLGYSVTTSGVVIAVLPDGFYIENLSSDWDSDVCTAEGIYVYTPSGVPSNAVLGYDVTVTGVVEASNTSSYAGTQIYIASPDSTNVATVSTGNSLPTAVTSSTLTSATSGTCSLYSAGSFGQWLPFEGMRVNVPSSSSLMVTQGTGGTVTPESQSATTNGQFWAALTTTRPFRATGISMLDTLPSTAPSTVQRWSGNPQLLLVDTTTLGGTAIDAAAGTLYTGSSNLIGIVDYHVSTQGYTGLLLTSATVSALSVGNTVTATAAPMAASGKITVATQDLNGLTAAETVRVAKLANAIVNYEHSPDILNVQGATPAALTALLSAVSSAGGLSYSDLSVVSTADSNGYVNAILVNTAKFNDPVVTRALETATYTTTSSTTATLFERCPLVLTAGIPRDDTTDYGIVVVNSSLTDRTNIDDDTLGQDVRNRRAQQAEVMATQILEPHEASGDHLFVTGGFDSFEFSDGYVDALGIIDGNEATNTASGSLVTLYDATYNSTALENTATTAVDASTGTTNAATNRYTYVESGSAEQPDHILISQELADLVEIGYARIGADFPVISTYDASSVNRASNHDGIVAYLTVPYPTTTTITSSLNPSYYGESVMFTATVTSTGGIPTGTVTYYDGTTELGTGTLSSGSTTLATSALTIGSHTIKAVYEGSAEFDASSATMTQVVLDDLATTSTLDCSPNPAQYADTVTCTDTATADTGTPTGTVTFYDGTTTLGTASLSSGVATFSTSTLAVGSHPITAVYALTPPYAASTSNTVTEVILSTFSLTATPSSRTIYTGEAATYTLTVTPGSGFDLDVALTCSGVPANATCTITPSTVTGGSGTAKLVVQSTAPSKTTASAQRGWPLLAGLLLLVPLRWKRWRGRIAILLLGVATACFGFAGCGSSGTLSGGTTAGSYTITITGTAVAGTVTLTQSTTVTTTVKSLF
jgi:uncharacterized protein